jgi:hypothetical protein
MDSDTDYEDETHEWDENELNSTDIADDEVQHLVIYLFFSLN